MICPKCKREIRSNIHICPHCGALVNNKKSDEKEIKTAKQVKSKIKAEDATSLVGGTVSKEAFIKLKKVNAKKKEIVRKDFNNYIDYKEAKERALEEMNKPNASKTRSIISSIIKKDDLNSSGTISGKAVRKQTRQNKNTIKVVNKKNAVNPLVSTMVEKQRISNGSKPNNILEVEKVEPSKKSAIKIEKMKDGEYRFFSTVASLVIIVFWCFTIYYLLTKPENNYYFRENEEDVVRQSNNDNTTVDQDMLKYQSVSKSGQTGGSTSNGVTAIVYDNQYLKQFTIGSANDVLKLISTDSVKQKTNCPGNITKIENEIITNYGIRAANLCEMDEDFVIELRDVIKYIYNEFPTARNYLTNITLANVDEGATYMAAFMPVFTFATSPSNNGYPVGIKTQIILNAKYFLDANKIKNSVSYGSKSGYFPPNATRSSAVAHEFGHYLSYVALLNEYDTDRLLYVKASESKLLYDVYKDFNDGNFSRNLLNEAYNEYHLVYNGSSFEDFRKSISNYAIAKDSSGNYIYDETIAEAFHDVYLNGDVAEPASRYIVNKLKEKL